ncbi:unnamed protein product [Meganyctiphanes norvegica]|uniref:Cation efflux protein transmembrane domain-containing protein n=1 Tax=Meganyctiphanes norvegica TaxID=48144 RepID=A0AAV2R0T7_MEGNR
MSIKFIRPLKRAWLGTLRELSWLLGQWEAQKTGALVMVNLVTTCVLISWCHTTRSMALMAYTYLSWFSLLSLVTCLLCIWVGNQHASLSFTYGYVRLEVLSVFASVILCLLGSIIVIKETIERMLQPEEVHTALLIASMDTTFGMSLEILRCPLEVNLNTQICPASSFEVTGGHRSHNFCLHTKNVRKKLLSHVNR